MEKIVEISHDITISVQAHPSLFNYTIASWVLSIITTALILTVVGLMNTAVSDALFKALFFAAVIEMFLLSVLLGLLRRKLIKDAEDIADSVKKAVKEAD